MRLKLIILLFIGNLLSLGAQNVVKVSGEYTYYAEGNESVNEAKNKALEGAKLQALAKEFGTVVSQSNMQQETSMDGKESSYFSSLSSNEVKGEWLETVGEPEYNIDFAGDVIVVICKVGGKARRISNESVDFIAKILRNGKEEKFADVNFRNGDDMYLLFRAPVDGYVAVYLIDETPEAFCLLPYMDNASGRQKVKHNKEYVFFAEGLSPEGSGTVDEYTLTSSKDIERNQIYVIFSPEPFTKAMDSQLDEGLPRQLGFDKFSHWLSASRRRDTKMGLKVMHINIKK